MMGEEFITVPELLGLLVVFGGPVYLFAAAILYRWLRRHGLAGPGQRLRATFVMAGALAAALPLTVAVWILSAHLPAVFPALARIDTSPLYFAAYVTPPAVAASLIAFPSAAMVARLGRRAPAA